MIDGSPQSCSPRRAETPRERPFIRQTGNPLICWESASKEVRISPNLSGKALLLPAAAWRAGWFITAAFDVADQSPLLQQVALTCGILRNVVAFGSAARRLLLGSRDQADWNSAPPCRTTEQRYDLFHTRPAS